MSVEHVNGNWEPPSLPCPPGAFAPQPDDISCRDRRPTAMTQDNQLVFSNQACGDNNRESKSDVDGNFGMWFFQKKAEQPLKWMG